MVLKAGGRIPSPEDVETAVRAMEAGAGLNTGMQSPVRGRSRDDPSGDGDPGRRGP